MALRYHGFEVETAENGQHALNAVSSFHPDLMLLDIMLPDMEGFEVARRLGAQRTELPIIFLTARDTTDDKVRGLTMGGDDYVTKPFSPRELTLRVQAVLRRARTSDPAAVPQPVRSGALEVDVAARRARRDGQELDLTVREFDLLAFFVLHPGRAFTRAELLEQVWGWSFGDLSTITVYVRRLRDKVEQEPAAPAQLKTVWGVGYRWEADPA